MHYTFPKFCVMIEFFLCLWVQKWRFSYFLYYRFVFLYNSSVRIGSPWLFRACFHTKIFSKFNFHTHYNVGSSIILIESLKMRNSCRTLATSPSNQLWKLWIWVFWILMLCLLLLFFRSCLGVLVKNNPTEKQIDIEIQVRWKHGLAWKLTGECKVYR